MVPPPEKWSGLQDIEQRYRKRYVDLYTNPEAMQAFKLRSRVMTRMREYLGNLDFLEVDTPVLQAMAGGAAARASARTRGNNRMANRPIDALCINTIRTLSIDAVQQAIVDAVTERLELLLAGLE